MSKKILIMIVVVAAAIFIGVAVTVQKVNDPQLRRMLNQQNEVLSRIKNLERHFGITSDGKSGEEEGIQKGGALSGDTATRIEMKLDALIKMASGNARSGQAARQAQMQEDLSTVHEIPVGSSPVMGAKDAPITIVSFVDFECPFSARFQPVIAEVVKAYPGKVKQVLKNYPLAFHRNGLPSAKAALAAGEQGKYWEMVDLILKNQRELSDEKYKEMASELGLDVEKFSGAIEKKGAEWEAAINEDIKLGQKVGVRGTPTYYLNGRKTLSRDLSRFKTEIEAILTGEGQKP